jgi:hypothetical protein
MLALSLTPEPFCSYAECVGPVLYLYLPGHGQGDTIRWMLVVRRTSTLSIPYRAQLAFAPPLQNSRRLEPGLPKSHGDTILAASPHSPPAPPLHH